MRLDFDIECFGGFLGKWRFVNARLAECRRQVVQVESELVEFFLRTLLVSEELIFLFFDGELQLY